MDRMRRHKYADIRQDTSRMASSTISVAEKPTVVIQIMDDGSTVRMGNTMVLDELVAESSRANVKSPVDTTLMMRLTPTSSSSAGVDLLYSRCLTRLSSRGRAEPILAYTSSGGGGGGPYSDCTTADG